MNRTKTRVLSLVMAALLMLASLPWTLGLISPTYAQADGTNTIRDAFGVTREELVTWLESHENDQYYLTTPNRMLDWRSPLGKISKEGKNSDGVSPGLSDTGFVWHAACFAHNLQDDIKSNFPAWGGWTRATNTYSLRTEKFATKEEMLASGTLEKGDIIWIWEKDTAETATARHHVGFFWGNSPDEDRMWHSIGDPDNSWSGQNQIGIIEGTAENPVYQVYKFDKSGKGAIALEMASGDESITSGNDGYRLENAVFGVFASRSDAQTHDASKAIKTYSTDSQGTFETDREFAEGTYYVAETTAPLGYALDNGVYEVVVVSDQTAKVNGGALASIPLLGGIRLEKRSANPEITGNNSCYSLEGAEYGLFATSDDATTHDSSKATAQFATTQDGTFESELAWPAGTYYVAETKAAQGFALDEHVYATRIEAGKRTDVNSPEGFTSAFALHNPIVSWSAVRDAETQDGSAQGSATLAGATFQVSYYDGYYDSASLPSAPTRSWLVKTDADGTAWARDDLKASGDEFYRIDGEHIVLPLGTVTVTETQASQGYLEPPAEPQLMLVEPGTSGAELDSYTAPVISSSVERGGVAAGLVDRQNAKHLAQGSATLAGAVFEILSDNDRQVVVNGSSFAKGDVVGSIETELTDEERYIARTPDTWLPAGSYILRQTEAGKGYLLDDTSLAWRKSFAVAGQGDVTDLTQPDSCATNQVIRGDFRFSKADGVTDARLALIPFLVTSQTTGEQHVIMTDENGMASTANSWNAHEHLTNANDLAASPSSDAEGGYAVDESKLDPTAGAWFDGRADESVATTAVLGALPYDTYTVSELRVAANAGYELATFTANVTRNDLELDLGTVDGNPIQPAGEKADDSKTTPEPAQGDTREPAPAADDSQKPSPSSDDMEKPAPAPIPESGNDQEPAPAPLPESGDGQEPAPASGETHKPDDKPDATQGNEGESEGEPAEGTFAGDEPGENSPRDGEQTSSPSIDTTLADGVDGDHGAVADQAITLIDTVAYRGLEPGKTYVLTGTLHVRGDENDDEGPARDDEGNRIVATKTFTPDSAEGETQVTFALSAPNLAGQTVVAYEELTCHLQAVARHADISDEEQTVRFAAARSEEGASPAGQETSRTTSSEPSTSSRQPSATDSEGTRATASASTEASETASKNTGKAVLPKTGDMVSAAPIALAVTAALALTLVAVVALRKQRGSHNAESRITKR